MNEEGEYSALPFESFFAALPHERDVEEFYCYSPLEASVVAFRQPDAAHSAPPDLRCQCVDTKRLSRQARSCRQSGGALFEKALVGQHAVLVEQHVQLIRQARILAA